MTLPWVPFNFGFWISDFGWTVERFGRAGVGGNPKSEFRIPNSGGGRVFGDELSGRIDENGCILEISVCVVRSLSDPLALAVVVVFADEFADLMILAFSRR